MKKIFTILILISTINAIYAAPARPKWQTKTQPDGSSIEVKLVGDEFCHYWINRKGQTVQVDEKGYWRVIGNEPRAIGEKAKQAIKRRGERRESQKAKAAVGSPKGIVILVNFKDESFLPINTQEAINDMMNGENYHYDGATGSLRKYFSDQSNGKYTPEFDVVGPVSLPYDMAHYGGNDSEGNDLLAGDMIVEACSIADALHEVDFTRYDNDEDEYVDFVYVLYAGMGEADGGADNTIWPHAWNLESAEWFDNCNYSIEQRTFDGMTIDSYACSGELTGTEDDQNMRTGIGTIAHEFSHVIGLHDLYDTKYGQNDTDKMTPGAWHIMDDGSYNNNGKTPPNYSIYDKYYLGWLTPENPGSKAQALNMAAGEGYQLANCDTLVNATSYHTVYYMENRQQEGWDAHVPGHGLVIWKIMYNPFVWENNGINSTEGYLRFALVSATGETTGIGTASDPFPGSQYITNWTGLKGRALTDISESEGVVKLNYVADTGEGPTGPEELYVEDLHHAKAIYYSTKGVEYYYFDLYNGEDTISGEMLYPNASFTVVAKSKTAINGTYDILSGDFWRSTRDVVAIDETQRASVSIQHVNDQGDYSMKGSFVCMDGVKYIFEAVVRVAARDSDNDFEDITLEESDDQTGVENIDGTTKATYKILRNGELLIIHNGKIYRVDGGRR